MTKHHVHIIKMGGTIEFFDPAYDSMNTNMMKLDASIESYLKNVIKPHFTFSSEDVTQKDSRDIDLEDRNKLWSRIESSPHREIVITHGTFTMRETAKFLEQKLVGDKKIILTGSMIPIAGFNVSDAGFNLGFATASFINIEPGIYLCMNGGIFEPDEVEKNPEHFRFE